MCVCVSTHAHGCLCTACIWRPDIDAGYIPRLLLLSLWTVSSPNRLDYLANKTLLTPLPLCWDDSAHNDALLLGGRLLSNSGASTFYQLTCLFSTKHVAFQINKIIAFLLPSTWFILKLVWKIFFSNIIDSHFVTFPPVISSSGLLCAISNFLWPLFHRQFIANHKQSLVFPKIKRIWATYNKI